MAKQGKQMKANDGSQICRCEDFTSSLVKMTCKEQRLLKRPPRVFSDQFEVYVTREMERCVNVSDEERFQIHREVFQHAIEQFGEHRQILCDVKVQYDAAIRRRDQCSQQLQDLNRHLRAEAELHARKLKSAQVGAHREVESLHLKQAQMRHSMALLSEQKQELARELEEVREALLVERRRYREEHDAHQVTQNDLVDLTQRYDNLLRRLNSRPPPADYTKPTSAADDPIVLRVALNKCREELSAVSARLVVMETSYSEVVPLRDLKLAVAETERVRTEGEERLTALQQVLQQERETEVFRTPRPDWNRAAAYVPGGESTWLPLRDSLPSSDVMQVLLDQLSAPGPDFFTGLGTESDIPAFLKWQGEIRNLRLTRRQAVQIICDMFECKEHNEESLRSFVTVYFKERYPFSWVEWIYSFHYVLERLTAYDAHHLLLGQHAPASDAEMAAGSPPEAPPRAQPPEAGSGQVPPPPATGQASPPTEGSSRVPSAPEKLQQMLEQRQPRHTAESAASEDPAAAHSSAHASEEEEVVSRAGSAPAGQPPTPEPQNRLIQLFWSVLHGVQHEDVYRRHRSAIQQLKKEFSVADAEKQGKVPYDSLGRIVSEMYFTSKTDEQIQRLVLAAAFGRSELEPGHVASVNTVDYSRFLDMCRETDSAFLQEFYRQMDRASTIYIEQLTELLSDGDVIQRSTLSQAVTSLTPDIAAADLQRLCCWVCPEDGQGVSLEQCIERLRGLPLPPERTTPGDQDTA